MPERTLDHSDRKAQAVAERVFSLVEGYKRRIIQARTDHERDNFKAQISGELDKVRGYVVGADRKRLNATTAHRITGEYVLKATHLEEAVLESGVADASTSAELTKLRDSILPIPKKMEQSLNMNMARYLGQLQGMAEARGKTMDPAYVVFFYDAGMKRMAMPDFEADEWYGEVMSSRSDILRKAVLPMVAIDQIEKAAREGAKAMPDHEKFMEFRHRAINALDELIDLWQKDLPAVADKYQLTKQALDHELVTLSLYHRYEERK